MGCSQGINGRHVDLVWKGREDLGKENATAVLVVRVLGHFQRLLVVSVEKTEEIEKKSLEDSKRPRG